MRGMRKTRHRTIESFFDPPAELFDHPFEAVQIFPEAEESRKARDLPAAGFEPRKLYDHAREGDLSAAWADLAPGMRIASK